MINNDTDSIPKIDTLKSATMDELKTILEKSEETINNLIASAIMMESHLQPIFDNYKKIRSDLRTELQTILQDQATKIQVKWTNITGQITAIQTNIQILQAYITPEERVAADSIINSIDDSVAPNVLQGVQEVSQSTKIVGFYNNISYMKMIKIQGDRENFMIILNSLEARINNIYEDMNKLQGGVLVNLQGSIEKLRTALNNSIISAQMKLSDNNAGLQTIRNSIQPKAEKLTNQDLNTISNCIEVQNGIAELNTQIQTLVGN